MVVAVVAVLVMQMPVHHIVDVISVRHGWVTAIRTVGMASVVTGAVVRNAPVGIVVRDRDRVLVVVVLVSAVQVAVMKVTDVVIVFDRHVTAVGSVLVRMV